VDRSWIRRVAVLITVTYVGFGLLGAVGQAQVAPRSRPVHAVAPVMYPLYLLLPRPRVVGFYENTASTPGGTGSYASFAQHVSQLRVVSPLWFTIGSAGTIVQDRSDPRVVALARRHGVLVLPLVNNAGSQMLENPGARARAVRSLYAIARRPGYGGVVVDFELLPATARLGLTALLAELGQRLHHVGKRLGVAVFPKVGVVGTLPVAYDYRVLGQVADDVVLMTYDAHYDGGAPGPVAPYPWVEANLLYALRFIPRGHLDLGIGLYGYDWPSTDSAAPAVTLSMAQALAKARALGVRVRIDRLSGEGTYRYTDAQGQVHTVWFETPASVGEKAALARRYAVGGVALWRLGFETPQGWAEIMQGLRTGRNPPLAA
jgi:spore germination protein